MVEARVEFHMGGELKDDGDWVPATPTKTVQEYSSVDSGKERDIGFGNMSATDFAGGSEISGCNASLGLNGCISDLTTSKVSDATFSLNKKRKPKVKKHRPKIFDETKPRKTSKSPTVNPLTPKQETPRPRRSTPRTSPIEKRKCTRKQKPPEVFDGNLEIATKSCRRELVFNHARDQHGHDSVIDVVTNGKVMETSFAKDEHVQMMDGFQHTANSSSTRGHGVDQTSYCVVKGFTDSLNAYTESSVRDSLEDTTKQDFNLNLEVQDFDSPRIGEIVQQYQRRKKGSYKEDLNFEEKISTPEEEVLKVQYGARFSGLKVYKRILRPNDCLKNSKKLGPNFPRMFKKKRRKQQRATKFQEIFDPCTGHKVTPTKRRSKSSRSVMKICPSTKLADRRAMDNELLTNFVMKEYNLRLIQPSQRQISDAMADPKSFNCVWSLCPMTNFRKKRSLTRRRKQEEMKHPEPLTWSVQHKRKRSKISTRRRDLSSLCLGPTAFPLKALTVVTKDPGQENVEDCAKISEKHLGAHNLVETPIFLGQHLDLKHMFSNLNVDEVQGVTDFISQKLERLCISDANNQLVVRDQKISGTMLPYEGKFDPKKKRKLVPKVDIDVETVRVWNLLMETDGSEDIGEGDHETKINWDGIREMYLGRIQSFISCMHIIQGDRRFSPWKGSVVDSVIGVFLTQNVSDHLSSSAFMSLVAKFPPSVNSNKNNVGVDNESHNEETCLWSTEQDMRQSISDVKYGDKAQNISDLSEYKSSSTIAISCPSENSSIFRQTLLDEEHTFLQQYYSHEEHGDYVDYGASQRNTCDLRSDKVPDLDPDATSSLTRSHNLVADLENININSLSIVDKNNVEGRNKSQGKEKQESPINWDDLRKEYSCGRSKDSVNANIDSADWEAVRQASVQEVAKVIMDRGMNNILAGRIKEFLDRMIQDHGTIDLEWLRDVPPDKAKDYLLSIPGLGLKSTECVRLLTLRHHAFPVDTNVGRILVRLGWVPLLPLPEDVQLHNLNNYPLVDSIQKYIWPRLCKISSELLYECHYQLITFGKVFCTKRQPNCNACPMRGQCRHFASAYASTRLRLRAVQGGGDEYEPQVKSSQNVMDTNTPQLVHSDDDLSRVGDIYFNSESIVEFPPSPEPASREMAEHDIEDFGYESDDEIIPTIKLNQEEFTMNLLDFMEKTNFLNGEGTRSKALVAMNPEAASIPMPKLKFVSRLRTEHQVYEVPDLHPLLAGFEKREVGDPCPYLLSIWPNENAHSSQPPKGACGCQESITCDVGTCCLRDEVQRETLELIQGTILIPCRTANGGSFPLNGTYFQVNEVFADHETSRRPIPVPRKWLWNLRRRSLYCGTSTTSIFRGMTTYEVQSCFWKGFICVRATDRVTREPRPLSRRFHICKSRQVGDE